MSLSELYQKAHRYWIDHLKKHLNDDLKYHSIDHTLSVLASCEQIGRAEGVEGDALLLLKLAAIFHDSGFLVSSVEHEKRGCAIADDYLKSEGLDSDKRQMICNMIMATKIPQTPKSKLGEILCDADLAYLGADEYDVISSRLREELRRLGTLLTDEQWLMIQISFLKQHNFFTNYAMDRFSANKQKHLKRLEEQVM